MILPPALNEWLPEDHPVHFIRQVVDQPDLSAIYNDYTERWGQPPYEPRMTVKVWLHVYMRLYAAHPLFAAPGASRVRRRGLPGAFCEPAARPMDALSNFRRRHHAALARLFVQSVRLSQEAGLVKLRHVAVDGTKLSAPASKHSAMTSGRMKPDEGRGVMPDGGDPVLLGRGRGC